MKVKRYDADVLPSQITPRSDYLNRRRVVVAAASLSAISLWSTKLRAQATMLESVKSPYSVSEAVTPIEVATTKTRFRELEPDIEKNGQGFADSSIVACALSFVDHKLIALKLAAATTTLRRLR